MIYILLNRVPSSPEDQIRPLLGDDEDLLWAGRPRPEIIAARKKGLLFSGIGLLLLCGAWALLSSWGKYRGPTLPWQLIPLVGIVGLWLTSAMVRARREAAFTVYAVSSSGLLRLSPGFFSMKLERVVRDRIHEIRKIFLDGGEDIRVYGVPYRRHAVIKKGETVGYARASEAEAVLPSYGLGAYMSASSRIVTPLLLSLPASRDPGGLEQALGLPVLEARVGVQRSLPQTSPVARAGGWFSALLLWAFAPFFLFYAILPDAVAREFDATTRLVVSWGAALPWFFLLPAILGWIMGGGSRLRFAALAPVGIGLAWNMAASFFPELVAWIGFRDESIAGRIFGARMIGDPLLNWSGPGLLAWIGLALVMLARRKDGGAGFAATGASALFALAFAAVWPGGEKLFLYAMPAVLALLGAFFLRAARGSTRVRMENSEDRGRARLLLGLGGLGGALFALAFSWWFAEILSVWSARGVSEGVFIRFAPGDLKSAAPRFFPALVLLGSGFIGLRRTGGAGRTAAVLAFFASLASLSYILGMYEHLALLIFGVLMPPFWIAVGLSLLSLTRLQGGKLPWASLLLGAAGGCGLVLCLWMQSVSGRGNWFLLWLQISWGWIVWAGALFVALSFFGIGDLRPVDGGRKEEEN